MYSRRPLLVTMDGQSNALGHQGTGAERIHNPLVGCYEAYPGTGQAKGWWFDGMDGPHYPYATTGNCSGYHVCDMLQRITGRMVLLVKQCTGGQALSFWWDHTKTGQARVGPGYVSLHTAFQESLDAPIPGRPDGKTLRGLGITRADIHLRHQGESDADCYGGTKTDFETGMIQLVRAYREPDHYGLTQSPIIAEDAPFICGELLRGGHNSAGQPLDDRNDALRSLAAAGVIRLAEADNLMHIGDNIHFTGSSLVIMARRMFHLI